MIVTRFAPSPTGYLHLGHAFAALSAAGAAKVANGRFLLRIEDLDAGRCRPEYEAAIYADLEWLGLAWEPPVLCQSTRADAYREALARLEALGLVYPCFCTRKEITEEIARSVEAPHGPESQLYPGTCRVLSEAVRRERRVREPYVLRLDVAKAAALAGALSFEEQGQGPNGERGIIVADPTLFGDIVLARKEMPAAYHLAVVVDDAFQGVSLVTRGNDLFSATHVQRLLQALLGLPAPAYAHHRLILDEHGRKFSKRDGSVTLRHLREQGETPDGIMRRLGF
ncbi:MAG: tRNA glutamyl-Q(34) synthetase GluQRS [Pseudomonadota bacterium]|nr:tRNA glutamyl-Q(34) synthetase GluQRS [Pseudomonadota bacterium]